MKSFNDLARELCRQAKVSDRPDLYEAALELQSLAANLSGENIELRQQVHDLKAELSALRERDRLKGVAVFKDGVCWIPSENNGREGPYCSRCFEVEGLLVHVNCSGHHYYCRNCKTGPEPRVPPPKSLARKPVGL